MRKLAVWIFLAPSVACAADSGEALFRTYCSPCHGAHGEGGRGANLAVRRLPRAPDDTALSNIISQGIPGTEMPITRMTPAENAQLVAYVRSLAQTQGARVPGDRNHGEQIFWGKGNCGQCHMVQGRGGRRGPDLTEIGTKRGPAYLRQALVEPEAEVPEAFSAYRKLIYMPDNYLLVRAVTRDGTEVTGTRVDEDAFTIQIRDAADRLYSFRKEELRDLRKDWGKSGMPAYRSVFSETELQDVVAYLASLQGQP